MSREGTSQYGASNDPVPNQEIRELMLMVMDMRERLARVEQRVDNIENDVSEIKRLINKLVERRNGLIKFLVGAMITVMVIVLSFVAAILGVHWAPPT